jgi:hypothetical protein
MNTVLLRDFKLAKASLTCCTQGFPLPDAAGCLVVHLSSSAEKDGCRGRQAACCRDLSKQKNVNLNATASKMLIPIVLRHPALAKWRYTRRQFRELGANRHCNLVLGERVKEGKCLSHLGLGKAVTFGVGCQSQRADMLYELLNTLTATGTLTRVILDDDYLGLVVPDQICNLL